MKNRIACSVALLAIVSTPAYAQLGGLGERLQQAQEAKDKVS
jgi:hypothetical protein